MKIDSSQLLICLVLMVVLSAAAAIMSTVYTVDCGHVAYLVRGTIVPLPPVDKDIYISLEQESKGSSRLRIQELNFTDESGVFELSVFFDPSDLHRFVWEKETCSEKLQSFEILVDLGSDWLVHRSFGGLEVGQEVDGRFRLELGKIDVAKRRQDGF